MEIPFVGREREIQEIKEGLETAKKGKGRLYFISGPVGIGKTRLIVEISKYAEKQGFAVLSAHCLDEKAVPYLPITDVLEKYSKPEEPMPLALSPFAEQTASAVAREKTRVLENYLRKFNEISQRQAVLFILDDLQWADSGTLSFLHYLSRAIAEMPILAIAAYAEEYLRMAQNPLFLETIKNINIERNCISLTLSPLGVNEISIILGSILGTWKLPKELVEDVYERTGGNPLFVEEVAKAISEQGLFDAAKRELKVSIDEIRLPDTVKTIISQRLSRLDEDTKKVLRAAAILGRIFEYTALKNTLDMDEENLLDILDKLIATGYIEESQAKEEIYRFVHNPVYEVIYDETSMARRRIMHKKAGIELEKLHGKEKKYYAEIGRHYLLGAEPEKGIAYKILAGEFAMANYAVDEALKNLLEAAAALENIKEAKQRREFSLKIQRMLGECYAILSDFEKAIAAYEKALESAYEPESRVAIMIKMVYPYIEKGDFSKCMEILEEAKAIAGEDVKLLSEIHRNMGWVYERKGDYRVAVEHYQKAVELSEKAGDETLVGEAYHRLGTAFWFLGELKKAKDFIEKGLEIREKYNLKRELPSSYNILGIIYGDLGEIDKALEFYDKAKRLCEEMGYLAGLVRIYNNIAAIYWMSGEHDEALEFFEMSLEISIRIGDKVSESIAANNIGEVYYEREDYRRAVEFYERAVGISKEIGEKRMFAGALANLAVAYAAIGEINRGLEAIWEARKVSEETESRELIANVLSALGKIQMCLKNFEASEEAYNRALKLYEEIDKLDSYWETKVELARLYIDTGRHDEALKLLNEAKAFFTKIGSARMLKKIEKELGRIKASLN